MKWNKSESLVKQHILSALFYKGLGQVKKEHFSNADILSLPVHIIGKVVELRGKF